MFPFATLLCTRAHALVVILAIFLTMSRLDAASPQPAETGNGLNGTAALSPVPGPEHAPTIATVAPDRPHASWADRWWIASMFAVAGATSADAATSWGYREANGTLKSGNGTFGGRGVAIKLGAMSALLVPEILLRRNEGLRRIFTAGNFVEAGIFGGTAIYNVHAAATQRAAALAQAH